MALTTATLPIPKKYFEAVTLGIKNNSVIAGLCTQTPQLFTDANHIVFASSPLAEFVGESGDKSSSMPTVRTVPAKIHKLQTTVRMSNETNWLDEDNQLELLDNIFAQMNQSISEGLDYGLLHGWNPLGASTTENLLAQAIVPNAIQVESTGDIQKDLDNLPTAVLENYDVNGIALDRMYANELRIARVPSTGAKMYPEVNMNLEPGNLEGLRSITSGNVGGKKLMGEAKAKAIVGDWSMVKWGVVRDIAIKPIEFGDPDGAGDLQRKNHIAYRCELVLALAVLDPKAFAALVPAAA